MATMLPERGAQLKATETSLQSILKDGVVLCELINKIMPNSVKRISTINTAYKQMENINSYLGACRGLGLQKTQLFDTIDLFEGKGMLQVLNNIYALLPLGERAKNRTTATPTSSGPSLVPSTSSSSIAPKPAAVATTPTTSAPAPAPTPSDSLPGNKSNSFTTTSTTHAGSTAAPASSGHVRVGSSAPTKVDVPMAQVAPVNTRDLLIAQRWIERCLDIQCPADTSFALWLKSGVILCRLVNKARAGIIPKIYEGSVAYQQIENIQKYLRACKIVGLKDLNLFDTNDLFLERDINLVVNHVHVFARIVGSSSLWKGPLVDDFLSGRIPLEASGSSPAAAPTTSAQTQQSVDQLERMADEITAKRPSQAQLQAAEDEKRKQAEAERERQAKVEEEQRRKLKEAEEKARLAEEARVKAQKEAAEAAALAKKREEEEVERQRREREQRREAERKEADAKARREAEEEIQRAEQRQREREARDKLKAEQVKLDQLKAEQEQIQRRKEAEERRQRDNARLAQEQQEIEKQRLEATLKQRERDAEAKATEEAERKLAEMARKLELEASKRLEEMAKTLREEAAQRLEAERKLREETLLKLEEEQRLRAEAYKKLEQEKLAKETAAKQLEERAAAQLETVAKKLEAEAAKRLADVATQLQQEATKKLQEEQHARKAVEEESAKLKQQKKQLEKEKDEKLKAELLRLEKEKDELKRLYDERFRILEKQLQDKAKGQDAGADPAGSIDTDNTDASQELAGWRKNWRKVTKRMSTMKRELTFRRSQTHGSRSSSNSSNKPQPQRPNKPAPKVEPISADTRSGSGSSTGSPRRPLTKVSKEPSFHSSDDEAASKPSEVSSPRDEKLFDFPRGQKPPSRTATTSDSDSASDSDSDSGSEKGAPSDDEWSPEGGFQNDEEWSTEEEYTDEDESPSSSDEDKPDVPHVAAVKSRKPSAAAPSTLKANSKPKLDLNFDDDSGWDQFSDIKFK